MAKADRDLSRHHVLVFTNKPATCYHIRAFLHKLTHAQVGIISTSSFSGHRNGFREKYTSPKSPVCAEPSL